MFAYARQMLRGPRQDAEDTLQDIFVRAYAGLKANDEPLALRAWLYRIAHNRCIDELRRPAPPPPEVLEMVRPLTADPIAEAEQRESLRRLVQDVRRLPDQQRSALLMRELGGMTYAEMSDALGVSGAAVKSLLVRARVGLAQAAEARDTACSEIREELIVAHDRGVRPGGTARRHIRDCAGCTEFRTELRSTSRQFAALVPALGPLAIVANLLGIGSSAGSSAAASSGAAASGGAAAGGGAAAVGTGGAASVGLLASGAGHVATLLAAAVVTAGGAVEIQHTIAQRSAPHRGHRSHARTAAARTSPAPVASSASSHATDSGATTTAPAGASQPVATSAPSAHNTTSRPVAKLTASPAPTAKAPGSTTSTPPPTEGTPATGTPTGTPPTWSAPPVSPTDGTGVGTAPPAAGTDPTLPGPTTGTTPGDPTTPTAPQTDGTPVSSTSPPPDGTVTGDTSSPPPVNTSGAPAAS